MALFSHDIPSCVLVRLRTCRAPRHNATTAWSRTSTGVPIAVTLCISRPPALSRFYVNCLGIESTDPPLLPKVVTEDADLVVLRVPLDSRSRLDNRYSDYFVYRVDPRCPSLHLLPNPFPETFGDNEIAVLSCNGDNSFVVAALQTVPQLTPTFKLHLYRSTGGKQGSWTSRLLSVEKPLRDKAFPVPGSADRQVYHMSTKVITLGGENKGTVGWVDLWRGILVCDVLSLDPKLVDIPLPSPAKGNLKSYLNRCPTFFRDITVNRSRNAIKYVEVEITPPKEVFTVPLGTDPDQVLYNKCLPRCVIPGSWTATTWKMPIWDGSLHKWQPNGTVHLANLNPPVGNQRVYKLLDILLSTSDKKKPEATEAALPLGCLCMAYPTLSVDDDDVVYFLSKGTSMGCMGSMEAVVAVDMRTETLRGMALLDTTRHIAFMRSFVASGISNYVKTAGIRASLGHAEEHISEQSRVLKVAGVTGPALRCNATIISQS